MYSYYSQITKKHISGKFPGEIPGIFRVAFRVAQCVVLQFLIRYNINSGARINHEKASVYQRFAINSIKCFIYMHSVKMGSNPPLATKV